MKILITGGKSAIALKVLKAFVQHEVVLADYGEMPSFSSSSYTFTSLGVKNEDTIAHNLLNKCLDENVDMVLPLHVFESIPLVKSKVLFAEFNIDILLPDDNLAYEMGVKYENWAVFINGEVLFSTKQEQSFFNYGKDVKLNGAFYYNYEDAVANFRLITI